MALQYSDIELQVDQDNPDYLSVLGLTYTKLTGNKANLHSCDGMGTNVILVSDLAAPTGTANFSYRKASSLKLETSVEDIKQLLLAAGVPSTEVSRAVASIKASFAKANNNTNTMEGTFYRIPIKDAVIKEITARIPSGKAAQTCASELRKTKNASMITSIAVVHLNGAAFFDKMSAQIDTEVDAALKGKTTEEAILAVRAKVSKSIEQSLSVTLGKSYRVISWDYIDVHDLQ
jgi:uncharacterized protein YoaH (UPF0181 family)